MNEQAYGMLGLAAKAGRCVLGESATVEAAQRGKAKLLLVDPQAGVNTADRIRRLATAYSLPCLQVEELGRRLGKPGRMAGALCDAGFAKSVLALTDQTN